MGCQALGILERQDGVAPAVTLKHRYALEAAHQRLPDCFRDQRARQQEERGRLLGGMQRYVAGHHRALREPAEQESRWAHSELLTNLAQELRDLGPYGWQGRWDLTAAIDALTAGTPLEELHVEHPPGATGPPVQGEWRFGEHEPWLIRKLKHVGKVDQVVARRSEAMHQHDQGAVAVALSVDATRHVGVESRKLPALHGREGSARKGAVDTGLLCCRIAGNSALPTMTLSPRLRSFAISGVLALGLAVFAMAVHEHYPLQNWLFFRYLTYWTLCALMAGSCLALGHRIVRWLGGSAVRFSEHVQFSFACGVLAFGLGVFVAGLLGLYGPVFFFAWPLAMLLAAGRASTRDLARDVRRTLLVGGEARALLPRSLSEWLRCAFLLLGLVAVYTQVITPENVSYDSRWYHLGLAEQYAAQGGIRRFPEGFYLGAYPQFATWLYTWAFQLPGTLFDRVALSSHVEWTLFLITISGTHALVRRLTRGVRVRWSGAAWFLFPSILIYDSNLNSGADHILAFWAIPLALAVCTLNRAPTVRISVLLSAIAAGALLTKYQAIYLIVPAALTTSVLIVRARRFALVAPAVVTVLVLTAPHWLKNAIYYGDPMYPMLQRYLPGNPSYRGAREAMDGGFFPPQFMVHGTFVERVFKTLKVLPTFAFVPHNWKHFEIPEPTFGALFTLLGPVLPFLARVRRIWLLTACTYVGVFIWFWTNHQDRYLQALLPWMVCTVVAIGALLWKLGLPARAAFACLVAFQVVSGSDIFFYPTHRMIKDIGIKSLADFISAGHRHDYERRFEHWGTTHKLAESLPLEAVPIVHDKFLRLGLARSAITDQSGFQGAIGYPGLSSTRAVFDSWRRLGATHVIWGRSRITKLDRATLAREAVFYEAAVRSAKDLREAHGFHVVELADEPPASHARVLRVLGCNQDPPSGFFRIAMGRGANGGGWLREVEPRTPEDVTVVAVRPACGIPREVRSEIDREYRRVADLGGMFIYVRP